MRQGQLLAGRFEIEHEVASGGMGTVYRALDRKTGEPVALKVLRGADAQDAARFRREAWILAELKHPGIVRYVDEGLDLDGAAYLVMEWLTGEDLNAHLLRAELSIAESVALVRRVAEALAVVHAQGMVHRDIKPHNLFLPNGSVEDVKLIDFGIARRRDHSHGVTGTGTAIGTPGYMAPEQARGDPDIDARVDVFSLGCVLFRCLTGQAPFHGDHVVAVLAKVLLEEAPRVSELVPGIPEGLDALVARMLSKRRQGRPADGAAVVRELAAFRPADLDLPVRSIQAMPLSSLTGGEQRLVSVLLIGAEDDEPRTSPDAETVSIDEETVAKAVSAGFPNTLRALLGEHGVDWDRLADGTRVAVLMGRGPATDQAASAARTALALRDALPHLPIALSTGQGRVSGRWPVGDVIDRAALLLRGARESRGAAASPGVRIDELTAGLLGDRFEVEPSRRDFLLKAEPQTGSFRRTLLGKPTVFVGRERELRTLEDLFLATIADPAPSAVLVTADPGVGKSRLAQELVARVEAKSEPIEVWIGRGDQMRAGAPLGLLAQVIKSTARISDGEPLEQRRNKLIARVSRHVAPAIQRRVTEFLGEMVGTPFPDDDSVPLRAARRDAMLLGDQIRRAWVDFLGAECRAQPILLVLEDLHWGDAPSVELVDTALRLLDEQPLMVLALARPSVHELFPRLWRERRVTLVRLGELSRKACERLSRQVLGASVSPEMLASLWERSAGNAFFLEELLRAIADGRGEGVPGTVLAMVQSRLEGLAPEARRILRAASVFGEVFWRGAVAQLLGGAPRMSAIEEALTALERDEWIMARREARFHSEKEYAFRHALVRGAAYGMLTDEDRPLGHKLAGQWLEQVGELDAMVLAEHFDRGGEKALAARRYLRAAEQSLSGNDLRAVIDRAERAVVAGLAGEALGDLALIRAEAHRWLGESDKAEEWALQAMQALPKGSARWYQAAGELSVAASRLVHVDRLAGLAEALSASWSEERVSAPEVMAMARVATQMGFAGARDAAVALQAKIVAVAARFEGDAVVSTHILYMQAIDAYFRGDISEYRALTRKAIVCFEQAGDVRNACMQRANESSAANELGDYAGAVTLLRAVIGEAEQLGLAYVVAYAQTNLGFTLARTGTLDEARAMMTSAIEYYMEHEGQRMEAAARIRLSAILKLIGDLEGAEAEARRALNLCEVVHQFHPLALAHLASAQFAGGRVTEALASAREAAELMGTMGQVEVGEAIIPLTFADVLEASGDRAQAAAVISTAKDRLLARAAKIGDPVGRESFLTRVPEHARTLELARAWL